MTNGNSKVWQPRKCKLQIVRIREPYEIGIGYALKRNCPRDMNLDPQEMDAIADAIFELPVGPDTPPTFISSAQKPRSQQTAKNASKLGGERITKVKEKVIDEETQDEKEVRVFKRTGPEPTTRFAYPLPRELCILWHSEDIPSMLIAQHTHDSRYRAPHFPDATELPRARILSKSSWRTNQDGC